MRTLLFLLVLGSSCVCVGEEKVSRVVCSVANVFIARPPHQEFVEVLLRIHSPSELSGSTIVLITDSRERGQVRRDMPLGRLYVMTLPQNTIADLKRQRARQEKIETSVDRGIPPEIISDALTLTQIRLVDLPAPLEPLLVNREKE